MKYFTFFLSFVLVLGCSDLKHDNPLDPENSDAEADQIGVVEDFIVHYTNFDSVPDVVKFSQDALYELKGDYGRHMLILEYHMVPSNGALHDSLASTDFELRYSNEYQGSTARGFPHAFFNGKQTWIQGASSKATVKDRYKIILDSLTLKKVKLYCEGNLRISADSLSVEGQIARYGDGDISNLVVEMMVVEDMGDYLHYVVRDQLLSQTVTNIPAKSIYDLTPRSFLIPTGYSVSQLAVVILIKDAVSKKILQAALAE